MLLNLIPLFLNGKKNDYLSNCKGFCYGYQDMNDDEKQITDAISYRHSTIGGWN